MSEYWRKCSSCKKELGFSAPYVACNVSTCNRKRVGYVFCSVGCWDAHVPIMNHRDSWSVEKMSPSKEEYERETSGTAPVNTNPGNASPVKANKEKTMSNEKPLNENEVLVVVSKLKAYVKAKSGGLSTSADVMPRLSDIIRSACDDAIVRARNSGRKTVMARDFE